MGRRNGTGTARLVTPGNARRIQAVSCGCGPLRLTDLLADPLAAALRVPRILASARTRIGPARTARLSSRSAAAGSRRPAAAESPGPADPTLYENHHQAHAAAVAAVTAGAQPAAEQRYQRAAPGYFLFCSRTGGGTCRPRPGRPFRSGPACRDRAGGTGREHGTVPERTARDVPIARPARHGVRPASSVPVATSPPCDAELVDGDGAGRPASYARAGRLRPCRPSRAPRGLRCRLAALARTGRPLAVLAAGINPW